jgi:hypothetical protein
MIADFQLFNHISIFTLQPLTPAADLWIEENLPARHICHGNHVAIEPRYLEEILVGIEEDGLTLNQDPLFR